MAYKLVYNIKIGTGTVTPSLNHVALPFRLNITSGVAKNNAAALMADMRAYGSPVNSIQSIARWNLDVSIWETRISFAGKNFPLTPGEGYRITPTVPLVVYKIVGAHNESANLFNLRIGAGTVTPSLNYIALPYHFDIVISLYTNDAKALRTHIRTYGNPAYSISSVGRWDSDTGLWQVVTISGYFPLLPGEAYRIPPVVPLVQWHCPVAVPGP
jgi:hypothetical protein